MPDIEEVYKVAMENQRAIKGGNSDGGLVANVAVLTAQLERIEPLLDRIDQRLESLDKSYRQSVKNVRKELKAEFQKNLDKEIEDVRERGPDWKWLVTTGMAIIGPIIVGILMSTMN